MKLNWIGLLTLFDLIFGVDGWMRSPVWPNIADLARPFEFEATMNYRLMSSRTPKNFAISPHFPKIGGSLKVPYGWIRVPAVPSVHRSPSESVWAMVNEDLRPPVVEILEKAFIQAPRSDEIWSGMGLNGLNGWKFLMNDTLRLWGFEVLVSFGQFWDCTWKNPVSLLNT